MGIRPTVLLCVALLGCGKVPTAPTADHTPPTATPQPDAAPWPGLKALIVVDLTPPEVRPVDLEGAADKALRAALVRPGRFHSGLAGDATACAIEVKTFYGLVVNGELQAEGDQGQARLVMEAEAHCPAGVRSAGEVETYRVTVQEEAAFSTAEASFAALRGLVAPLGERVAATLYGQVTVRHAEDPAVVAFLGEGQAVGILMEASAEAGERKLADAVPRLVALTAHADEVVALRATAALGLIGLDVDGVISALARMTEGPDPERHLIAVHAMGDIGGTRAARYLDALAVGHPEGAIREAARDAARRAREAETNADTVGRPGHDAPPVKP